jgi:TRAP transporter TAXI family solute receptor
MRALLLALSVLVGLATGTAHAAQGTIMTGRPTGTYIRFGQDIATIAKHFDLDLEVLPSAGSLENVEAVLRRPNTQFGIVQSDVLDFIGTFSDDPELRYTAGAMRMIFPLYNEELHLLARPEIRTLSDLQGKRVAMGASASGTLLTATLLLATAGVEPAEELEIDTLDALAALRSGKIDAMIYVAGVPAKLFTDEVKEADGLHLVPIDDPEVLGLYGKSTIPAGTYSWGKAEVPTVAVRAVLMTYNFAKPSRYHRAACATVGKVTRMIASNLDWLRTSGQAHPKWREVDLNADVVNWQRSDCAAAGLKGPESYVLVPEATACGDMAKDPIRHKLCLVKQQLRQQNKPDPSAKVM